MKHLTVIGNCMASFILINHYILVKDLWTKCSMELRCFLFGFDGFFDLWTSHIDNNVM